MFVIDAQQTLLPNRSSDLSSLWGNYIFLSSAVHLITNPNLELAFPRSNPITGLSTPKSRDCTIKNPLISAQVNPHTTIQSQGMRIPLNIYTHLDHPTLNNYKMVAYEYNPSIWFSLERGRVNLSRLFSVSPLQAPDSSLLIAALFRA